MDYRPNCKTKTTKFLEENGSKYHRLWVRHYVIIYDPQSISTCILD